MTATAPLLLLLLQSTIDPGFHLAPVHILQYRWQCHFPLLLFHLEKQDTKAKWAYTFPHPSPWPWWQWRPQNQAWRAARDTDLWTLAWLWLHCPTMASTSAAARGALSGVTQLWHSGLLSFGQRNGFCKAQGSHSPSRPHPLPFLPSCSPLGPEWMRTSASFLWWRTNGCSPRSHGPLGI